MNRLHNQITFFLKQNRIIQRFALYLFVLANPKTCIAFENIKWIKNIRMFAWPDENPQSWQNAILSWVSSILGTGKNREYGGWGMITVLFLAKKLRTSNDEWAGQNSAIFERTSLPHASDTKYPNKLHGMSQPICRHPQQLL